MSALWFTFGRVLSDLEGSILGNSTNPLGVRWGRSDSERCSPPSSFPSVHLLTTFPFFTPLMWISPLTFHLFALKRAFSGEFPHLSTTFLSPSAICVQRDTSTFCSSWSTTGFQNQFWIIAFCVTFQCHTPWCRPSLFLSFFLRFFSSGPVHDNRNPTSTALQLTLRGNYKHQIVNASLSFWMHHLGISCMHMYLLDCNLYFIESPNWVFKRLSWIQSLNYQICISAVSRTSQVSKTVFLIVKIVKIIAIVKNFSKLSKIV